MDVAALDLLRPSQVWLGLQHLDLTPAQGCGTVNRSLVPALWPSGSGWMLLKVRLTRGPRSWYSFAT